MSTEPKDIHLVFLIHGIRTRAAWVPRVGNALETDGLQVCPCNYGYFDLLRFWWPWGTRDVPLALIERQIRSHKNRFEGRRHRVRMSAIAHSFGTYIVSRILEEATDLHWERLILCGAIIPENFPWDKVSGQIEAENVINEVGRQDVWPVIAKLLTFGYGDAGTYGFGYGVRDRFHNVGHGGYFEGDFPERFWRPWIHSGKLVESKNEASESPFPGWLGARGLKWFGFSVVALVALVLLYLVLGLPWALWTRTWWHVYVVAAGVAALGIAFLLGWQYRLRWACLMGWTGLIVGLTFGARLWLGPSSFHVDRGQFSELRAAGSWDVDGNLGLEVDGVPDELSIAPTRLRVDVTQGRIQKTIRSDQRPTIPKLERIVRPISGLRGDAAVPVRVRVRISDPYGVVIDEWEVPVEIGVR